MIQAFCQRANRAGGHQVTGPMVQCLDRQRRGSVGFFPEHASVGNAATHLYQAVETPAVLPGTTPTVGVEADINQARSDVLAFNLPVTETFQCVGAVTVEEDVGLSQ